MERSIEPFSWGNQASKVGSGAMPRQDWPDYYQFSKSKAQSQQKAPL
jgi:hypothetical protein